MIFKKQFDENKQLAFQDNNPFLEDLNYTLDIEAEKLRKKRRKYILLALALLTIFISLIILLIILSRKPEIQYKINMKEKVIDLSPLEEDVNDLEKELSDSDPRVKELPFPQVDMNIRIDED